MSFHLKTALAAMAALLALGRAQADGPLTLDIETAKRLAAAASPELRQGELDARVAAEQWTWGVRAFLPTLSVSASGDESVATGGPDSMSKRFSLSLSQLVFDGGKLSYQRRLSAIQLSMARKDLDRKRREVEYQAANLFYAIVAGERKLAITRDLVELSRAQEGIAAKEYSMGKITEVDLIEIQTKVLEAELDLKKAAQELDDQYFELRRMLGLDEGDELLLEGDADPGYAGVDLSGQLERLGVDVLRASDQLEQARLEVESLRAQLSFSERTWIPDVSLSLDCSLSGERFPLNGFNYGLSLSLSFPDPSFPSSLDIGGRGSSFGERGMSESAKVELFRNPAAFLDVASAKLAIQYKLEALDTGRQSLLKGLQRLALRYENERTVRSLTQRKLELAQKKRDIALKRLDLGQVTRKDYVVAESELAQARIELFSAWLTIRATEWELESALGLGSGALETYVKGKQ